MYRQISRLKYSLCARAKFFIYVEQYYEFWWCKILTNQQAPGIKRISNNHSVISTIFVLYYRTIRFVSSLLYRFFVYKKVNQLNN